MELLELNVHGLISNRGATLSIKSYSPMNILLFPIIIGFSMVYQPLWTDPRLDFFFSSFNGLLHELRPWNLLWLWQIQQDKLNTPQKQLQNMFWFICFNFTYPRMDLRIDVESHGFPFGKWFTFMVAFHGFSTSMLVYRRVRIVYSQYCFILDTNYIPSLLVYTVYTLIIYIYISLLLLSLLLGYNTYYWVIVRWGVPKMGDPQNHGFQYWNGRILDSIP